MDPQQREEFRDQVVTKMALISWTSGRVAKEAGLAENTITRVTNAKPVSAGTVLKIRKALEIPSLAEAQADAGYSSDIEWVRDVVGVWLRDTPVAEREAKANSIIEIVIKSRFKEDNESPAI